MMEPSIWKCESRTVSKAPQYWKGDYAFIHMRCWVLSSSPRDIFMMFSGRVWKPSGPIRFSVSGIWRHPNMYLTWKLGLVRGSVVIMSLWSWRFMRQRDSEAIGQEREEVETAVREAEDWQGDLERERWPASRDAWFLTPAEIFPQTA